MPRGPAKRPLTEAIVPALALAAAAALAADVSAAETWLHPVLPASVVRAAPAVRRGGRGARPAVPARSAPFPTAVSGDSSFVEVTTGDRYPEPGGPVPGERIERSFVRLGGGRPMPLTGAKTEGPVTRLEATWVGQGLATLGLLLAPEARTVEAAPFEELLREAGADEALALRAKRKETRKPARIVSIETARAFAGIVAPPRAGRSDDPAAGRDEPLGLPLELVASVPPLPLRAGTVFSATLLLDGRPLPGARVRALAPGAAAPVVVPTDGEGGVTLTLEREGRLLLAVSAVRRTEKSDRARGETWKKADWEVRRTTLELLVLPKAVVEPTPPAKGKRPPARTKPR